MLEFVFQILAYFSGIFSFMLYSGNKTIYKLANSHIRERGFSRGAYPTLYSKSIENRCSIDN